MIVELQNVSKEYGSSDIRFVALRSVNFRMEGGAFVTIVGPSGSGKSSLLHLLGCLDRPTSGSVLIDGRPIERLPDASLSRIRRERLGFVFQQFFLNHVMTALQNVLLPLELARTPGRADLARAALDAVGLSGKERSYPSQLSGGEQQRCAIARAIVHSPDHLLADEPTGSLDSESGRHVLELLEALRASRGLGLAVVTHDMAVAARAETRVEIRDGRIL